MAKKLLAIILAFVVTTSSFLDGLPSPVLAEEEIPQETVQPTTEDVEKTTIFEASITNEDESEVLIENQSFVSIHTIEEEEINLPFEVKLVNDISPFLSAINEKQNYEDSFGEYVFQIQLSDYVDKSYHASMQFEDPFADITEEEWKEEYEQGQQVWHDQFEERFQESKLFYIGNDLVEEIPFSIMKDTMTLSFDATHYGSYAFVSHIVEKIVEEEVVEESEEALPEETEEVHEEETVTEEETVQEEEITEEIEEVTGEGQTFVGEVLVEELETEQTLLVLEEKTVLPLNQQMNALNDVLLSEALSVKSAMPQGVTPTELPITLDNMSIEKATVRWVSASTGSSEPAKFNDLVLVPESQVVPNQQWQLDFALSGKGTLDVGDLEIVIPAYIWKDRDGNEPGRLTLAVAEEPASVGDFAWKRVGDTYVITNIKRIHAGSKYMIQGTFRMTYPDPNSDKPFSTTPTSKMVDKDVVDPTTEYSGISDDFYAVINLVTPSNHELLSATTNSIRATLDTHVEATAAQKRAMNNKVYVDEIPSTMPSEFLPENPEDYYYVEWFIAGVADGNQPYRMRLNDTLTDEYEGILLGITDKNGMNIVASEERTGSIDVYEGDSFKVTKSAYLWTAYPKEQFPDEDTIYTVTNDLEVEVRGVDDNVLTTKTTSASVSFKNPVIWKIDKVWEYNEERYTATLEERQETQPDELKVWAAPYNTPWRNIYYEYSGNAHKDILSDANNWHTEWVDDGKPVSYSAWEDSYRVTITTHGPNGVSEPIVSGPIGERVYLPNGSSYQMYWSWDHHATNYDEETHTWTFYNDYHEGIGWTHPSVYDKTATNHRDDRVRATSDRDLVLLRDHQETTEITYTMSRAIPLIDATAKEEADYFNPDDLNQRYVRLEMVDHSEYFESRKLAEEEYYVNSVNLINPTVQYWQPTGEETGVFSQPQNEAAEMWGLVNSEWIKFAEIDASGTITTFEGAQASDHRIVFPHDTVKQTNLIVRTNADILKASYDIGIILKPSDPIVERVEGLFSVTDYAMAKSRNEATYNIYDEETDELIDTVSDGDDTFLHGRNYRLAVDLDKETRFVENNRDNRYLRFSNLVTLNRVSNISARQEFLEASRDEAIPDSKSGIFYDVLPAGMLVDESSLKVSNGRITYFNIIENYQDSGSQLLEVHVDLENHVELIPSAGDKRYDATYPTYNGEIAYGWRPSVLTFDMTYSYDEAKNRGLVNLRNHAAYIADEDVFGNAKYWSGEKDEATGENHKETLAEVREDAREIMSHFQDRGTPNTVYAGANVRLTEVDFSALTDIRKQVVVTGQDNWSYGHENEVVVPEGGKYSYRIMLTSSADTTTKNIILLDSLEYYTPIQVTDSGDSTIPVGKVISIREFDETNRILEAAGLTPMQGELAWKWKGYFRGIDTSELENLGVKPVVYYSTTPNLDITGYNTTQEEGVVIDILQNSSDWSTTPPSDLSTVTAVAVDCRYDKDGNEFELVENQTLLYYMHMLAPIHAQQPDAFGEDYDDFLNNANAYNNVFMDITQVDEMGGRTHSYDHFDYTQVGIYGMNVKVNKIWQDDDNNDNVRPDEIEVELVANGEPTGRTLTINPDSEWVGIFHHVLEFDEEGNAINYTIKEANIPEYQSHFSKTVDGNFVVIDLVNEHANYVTEYEFSKQWTSEEPEGWQVYIPEYITVRLMADGVFTGKTMIVRPDENGNWSGKFTDLKKFNKGRLVQYSVQEVSPGSNWLINYNGSVIENVYHPYGDLLAYKSVTNATEASKDNSFEFILSLIDSEGETVIGRYFYEILNQNNEVVSSGYIGSGDEFQLKQDEYIHIQDIPSGTIYNLEEKIKRGYTLTKQSGTTGTITAERVSEARFTNEYNTSGSISLGGNKSLTGRDMERYQFRFLLFDANDPTNKIIRTASNTIDGTFNFGNLNFTTADDGGEFVYRIEEQFRGMPGYTYDSNVYIAKVYPVDNGDGTMTVTAKYFKQVIVGDEVTYEEVEAVTFDNTYHAEGEVILQAWKTLKNGDLRNYNFEFELYNEDNELLQTKEVEDTGFVLFDALEFDQDDVGKTFYYYIKERIPEATDPNYYEDVTYDDSIHGYYLTVLDNGNGTLSFTQGPATPFFREVSTGDSITIRIRRFSVENPTSKEDLAQKAYQGFVDGIYSNQRPPENDIPLGAREELAEIIMRLSSVQNLINSYSPETTSYSFVYQNNIYVPSSLTIFSEEVCKIFRKYNVRDWDNFQSENWNGADGYSSHSTWNGRVKRISGWFTQNAELPVFENELKPGELKVTKKVHNPEEADPNKEFHFVVKFITEEALDDVVAKKESTKEEEETTEPTSESFTVMNHNTVENESLVNSDPFSRVYVETTSDGKEKHNIYILSNVDDTYRNTVDTSTASWYVYRNGDTNSFWRYMETYGEERLTCPGITSTTMSCPGLKYGSDSSPIGIYMPQELFEKTALDSQEGLERFYALNKRITDLTIEYIDNLVVLRPSSNNTPWMYSTYMNGNENIPRLTNMTLPLQFRLSIPMKGAEQKFDIELSQDHGNWSYAYIPANNPGITDEFLFDQENPTTSVLFNAKATITFDTNGGFGSFPNKSVVVSEDYTLPTSEPYIYNQTFVGWKDSKENVYTAGQVIPAGTLKKDEVLTLTAVYEPNPSTPDFKDQGYSFTLKDGENITFENVPAGTAYQVWEETEDGWTLVEQKDVSGFITSLTTSEAEFTNLYQPNTTSVQFNGTKKLNNLAAEKDSFTFELLENGQVIETVKVLDGGFIQFPVITYDSAGVHRYTIREVDPEDEMIDYDLHEEIVTVTVTKNADDSLSSSVEYDSDGIVFENHNRPGNLEILKKGSPLSSANRDDVFTFKVSLENENGVPIGDEDGIYWYTVDSNGTIINTNSLMGTFSALLNGKKTYYKKAELKPAGDISYLLNEKEESVVEEIPVEESISEEIMEEEKVAIPGLLQADVPAPMMAKSPLLGNGNTTGEFTITYDAGEYGAFEDGSTTNTVVYRKVDKTTKQYSHTRGIDIFGQKRANAYRYESINETISVPGAEYLKVELKYGLNYSASLVFTAGSQTKSYSYSSGPYTTDEFTLNGDTVAIKFSNSSSESNYGYYAVITGYDAEGNEIEVTPTKWHDIEVVSGEYKEPIGTGCTFWNWDNNLLNVTEDTTFTAQYAQSISQQYYDNARLYNRDIVDMEGRKIHETGLINCIMASMGGGGYNHGWQNTRELKYMLNTTGKIIMSGSMHAFFRNSKYNYMDMSAVDVSNVTSLNWTFMDLDYTYEIYGLDRWDTSNVTDFCGTFCRCTAMRVLNIESWDTSNGTTMDQGFEPYRLERLVIGPKFVLFPTEATKSERHEFPEGNEIHDSITKQATNIYYNTRTGVIQNGYVLTDIYDDNNEELWGEWVAYPAPIAVYNPEDESLHIYPSSSMDDIVLQPNEILYKNSNGYAPPWYQYRSQLRNVTHVIVEEEMYTSSLEYWFTGLYSLNYIDISKLDLSLCGKFPREMGTIVPQNAKVILGPKTYFKKPFPQNTGNNYTMRMPTFSHDDYTGYWIHTETGTRLGGYDFANQYDPATMSGEWVPERKVTYFHGEGGYIIPSLETQYGNYVQVPSEAQCYKPKAKLLRFIYYYGGNTNPSNATPGDTRRWSEYARDFYAVWEEDGKNPIVTHHYQQNLALDDYNLTDSEIYRDIPGVEYTSPLKDYEGFHPISEVRTETIAEEEVIEVNYYYDRDQYTIRFDGNGATSGQMLQVINAIGGISNTLPRNVFGKKGSIFTGWNTKPDGSGMTYLNATDVVNIGEHGDDVVLYAQWLENDNVVTPTNGVIYVQCKANEKIVIPDLPYGTKYTIEEINLPTGWTKNSITPEKGTIETNITASVTANNKYEAEGVVYLQAYKKMDDMTVMPGQFSFELYSSSNTLLQTKYNQEVDYNTGIVGEDEENIPNPYYGMAPVEFDPIVYTASDIGRTFTYYIRETKGSEENISYDEHRETVTVRVEDGGAGSIRTIVTYDGDGAVFTNDLIPGSLHVHKAIVNETVEAKKDEFEYTIYLKDENGNPVTGTYPGIIKYENYGEEWGVVDWTSYSYTENLNEAGVKERDYGNSWNNYNIRGTGRESGSNTAHVITHEGADRMHVTIVYGGESVSYDWVIAWAGAHPNYTASSSQNESFTGRLGGGNHTSPSNKKEYDVLGDTVTFAFRTDGSVVGDGYGYYAVIESEREGWILSGYEEVEISNGSIFRLKGGDTLELNNLPHGTQYEIVETEHPGWDLTNEKDTTGSITAGQTQFAEFENTYSTNGYVQLEAKKTFIGGDIKYKKFDFELTDENGNVLRTATAGDDGTVTFAPIDYTQSDDGQRFAYYINEVIDPNVENMIWDRHVAEVIVDVMDNGAGELIPHVTYNEQDFNFTNLEYNQLEVTKQITGGMGEKTGIYNFTLNLGEGWDKHPITYTKTYRDGTEETGVVESNTIDFTLGHDDRILFDGLLNHIRYEVIEKDANQNGYRASAAGSDETSVDLQKQLHASGILDEEETITFINNREAVIPVGIWTNWLRWIPLVLLPLLWFIYRDRKQRKVDE